MGGCTRRANKSLGFGAHSGWVLGPRRSGACRRVLRAPAHYCGVLSHKPSLDLMSLRGSGYPSEPPSRQETLRLILMHKRPSSVDRNYAV